jgi:hypothetical protein
MRGNFPVSGAVDDSRALINSNEVDNRGEHSCTIFVTRFLFKAMELIASS